MMVGLTAVCSYECATEYGVKKVKKKKDDEFRVMKKRFKAEDVKTRAAAAVKACHAYVRFRDRNEVCPCCGEALGQRYHAGHFLESGNYSNIRYDERNIHGQREQCNIHKGGDSGEYEIRLRKKIGDAAVDELHRIKSIVKKWTADELREIELKYKAKLKELMDGDILIGLKW